MRTLVRRDSRATTCLQLQTAAAPPQAGRSSRRARYCLRYSQASIPRPASESSNNPNASAHGVIGIAIDLDRVPRRGLRMELATPSTVNQPAAWKVGANQAQSLHEPAPSRAQRGPLSRRRSAALLPRSASLRSDPDHLRGLSRSDHERAGRLRLLHHEHDAGLGHAAPARYRQR